MTEAEWLAASDVFALFLHKSTKGRFREWRLFALACSRRALVLYPDLRLSALADLGERFADGEQTWDEMKSARKILIGLGKQHAENLAISESQRAAYFSLDLATGKSPVASLGAAEIARNSLSSANNAEFKAVKARAEREQVALAREIFGNPFRSTPFLPERRASTVLALAQQMYDSRDFSAMPILAGALQDADCTDEAILTHCRGPGPHVRGCHAIDAIMGKL